MKEFASASKDVLVPALIAATKVGQLEVVRLLFQEGNVDPEACDEDGLCVREIAKKNGYVEIEAVIELAILSAETIDAENKSAKEGEKQREREKEQEKKREAEEALRDVRRERVVSRHERSESVTSADLEDIPAYPPRA